MLFNTLNFVGFLAILYVLYLVLSHRGRNWLLLAASLLFYAMISAPSDAWFNWKVLALIAVPTISEYIFALLIERAGENRRRAKLFVTLAVTVNLVILGFFKYFNFFVANVFVTLEKFGVATPDPFLRIALPVGISFYIFKLMTYSIDVYRGQMKPTRNFMHLLLYASFFPNLVAGPIDRARSLMPQIAQPRPVTLQFFYEGCFLFAWGLFLKAFIADNLSPLVEPVFGKGTGFTGLEVLLATYAFAIQIYCDFAGYSHMARGVGRILGFDLMVNFNLPYFATNPSDFWRRWHISLSTWLRDYLYIPLGGSRGSSLMTNRNLFLTMLLGGLWHGAAWTFIFWGIYQGVLLIAHRMLKPLLDLIPQPSSRVGVQAWYWLRVVVFFQFVCLGWMLFNASSLSQVEQMLIALATNFTPQLTPQVETTLFRLLFFSLILVLVQLYQFYKDDLMAIYHAPWGFRAAFYTACFYLLLLFGVTGAKEFIYKQF